MTTTMITNGRQRKSLADQIDRLDGILDGLSEGLQDAVVSAVQQAVAVAVRQAIQSVLTEVLNNPDFLKMLRSTVAQAHQTNAKPGSKVSFAWQKLQRLALIAGLTKAWFFFRWGQIRQFQPVVKQYAGQAAANLWEHWRMVREYKSQVLIALGIGVSLSVMAYFLSPWLGALVSGMAGFGAALMVQARVALRRLATSFSQA